MSGESLFFRKDVVFIFLFIREMLKAETKSIQDII